MELSWTILMSDPFKFLRITRDCISLEGDVFKRGVKIVSGHGSRQIPFKREAINYNRAINLFGGRASDFIERNFIAGEITRTRVTRPLRVKPMTTQDP